MTVVVVVDVGLEGVVEERTVKEYALSNLVAKDDFAYGFVIISKAWKHTNFVADIDTEYSMEEIGIAILSCLTPWVAMAVFGPQNKFVWFPRQPLDKLFLARAEKGKF
jgi:hypothetical protein